MVDYKVLCNFLRPSEVYSGGLDNFASLRYDAR